MTDIPTPYPLKWPLSWPRARYRETAKFHRKVARADGWHDHKSITMAQARSELQRQVDLLGGKSAVLSTNVELNMNGDPRGDRARPVDVGVAVYFKLNNRDTVLACDKWDRVEDNIVAIGKHIDVLRGQDRWGVGTLEQAFTGYQALPAPIAKSHWSTVLGIAADSSRDQIQEAWKAKARAAGTDQDKLYAANMARDEALAERTLR